MIWFRVVSRDGVEALSGFCVTHTEAESVADALRAEIGADVRVVVMGGAGDVEVSR
jgi:hypothetical protein